MKAADLGLIQIEEQKKSTSFDAFSLREMGNSANANSAEKIPEI